MKRFIKPALKLALVALLLVFLAKKGFISLEATSRAFSRPEKLLPAMGLLLTASCLGVLRWQWLLEAQGLDLKIGRTFQLTFIGNFFNISLPGAVSGDFVKAFYVGREVHGKRARAFGSILFDRVAGLSALVLLSTGALAVGFGELGGTPFFSAIRFFLAGPAIVILAFYGYLFSVSEKSDPVLKLLHRLEKRTPKIGSITRIYEGLRHYHAHRWTVVRVLLISVLIHVLVSCTFVLMLQALGETHIETLAMFVAVPIGLLSTAIPLGPAGVGTGHVAFGWLLQFLGTDRGADLFSLYAMTQLMIGALGGLVYLRFRAHEPKPALA